MAGIADIIRSLRGVGSDVANEGFSGFLPDWYKEKIVPSLEKFGGSLSGPTMLGDSPYADTMIRGQTNKSIQSPDAAKIMPNAVQRQDGMGLNNIAGRHGSFPLTEPPFGASGTLDTVLPEMGYDYTNEGYADLSGPWAPSYADEYAGERSPLNAVSQADWSSPVQPQGRQPIRELDQQPAPLVGNQFDHEPGGKDFRSSEYMRAPQPEEVGGGQGFDLLGWLNKLPSGARKREQDLATMTPGRETGFGSKRLGTTYDGSIQGGGYFTPEEYGRHYSQYGRGS